MRVAVVVPGALRQFSGGASRVELDIPADATVGTLLSRLAVDHPTLHRRVQDETGCLRRHVNVFVGETNVRDAQLLDTPLSAGVNVTVLPSVAGG